MEDYVQRACDFVRDWLPFCAAHQQEVPGVSVAIAYKGAVVHAQAVGRANISADLPLQTDDVMPIGSQSKLLTAIAVLAAVDTGRVSLDDQVAVYLPWLAGHNDSNVPRITIRQLLWHQSGLMRDGPSADFWLNGSVVPSGIQFRDYIMQCRIIPDFRGRPKYSNVGYALLGEALASATDSPYVTYAQDVWKQLHIAGIEQISKKSPGKVCGYIAREGEAKMMKPLQSAGSFTPAVGWCMSAADLVALTSRLHMSRSTGLPEAFIAALRHTPHSLSPDERYGPGIMRVTVDGRECIGHSGNVGGFASASYLDAEADIAVSVIANAMYAPVNDIAAGIIGAVTFFRDHPVSNDMQRFNVRYGNSLLDQQIIATDSLVGLINPHSWRPLRTMHEYCEVITANTLRIVKSSFFGAVGETISFEFENNMPKRVIHAGITNTPR